MKSDALLVHCQFALNMSQKALAELVGVNRRTVQRWQKNGCHLLPSQARTLADALQPTRPDLADAVRALGHKTAVTLGTAPASSDIIDAILGAATAAAAAGMTADAVRPVVAAAFARAAAEGVDVSAVVSGLAGG